jgi:glycosyltransferase involved in cell wall biosynthesis
VLTTYNRRNLLLQAIASVRNQTRKPDEIIVIDDGSTDGTVEGLKCDDVHYIWQENAGTSAARNRGWQLATGDWIAFLDSDDLWLRDKLALQEAAIREDGSKDCIFGHGENFAEAHQAGMFDPQLHRLGVPTPCWLPGAALIRRSLLEEIGGFDPAFTTAEAVDWIMRLQQRATSMQMLKNLVLRRRLHTGNKQLTSPMAKQENFELLRRWRQFQRTKNLDSE